MIVHEAPRTVGFGAELAALIAEKAIFDLQGPVLRVTGYDVPYPYWAIEDAYVPSVERVSAAVRRLVCLSDCGSGSSAHATAPATTSATRPPARPCASEIRGCSSCRSPASPFAKTPSLDASFDPGLPLALVPEPENEFDSNAVGIWNAGRTLQAGYVPREPGAVARRERAGSLAVARGQRSAGADRPRRRVGRAAAPTVASPPWRTRSSCPTSVRA